LRAVERIVGLQSASRLGTVLIGAGLLMLVYAAGMYVDLFPGNRVVVPRAPALEGRRSTDLPATVDAPPSEEIAADAPSARAELAEATAAASDVTVEGPPAAESSTSVPAATAEGLPVVAASSAQELADSAPAAQATVAPEPVASPIVAAVAEPNGGGAAPSETVANATAAAEPADPTAASGPAEPVETPRDPAIAAAPLVPSDAAERPYTGDRPPPGRASELTIPSIKMQTEVVSAGVVRNKDGEPEWETVPFVAAHYPDTSLVGASGNAVISGHVVTIQEGNVFRNLYLIKPGDSIETRTDEGTFRYVVSGLKEVLPTAVEVMAPTAEPTLTLITCAGEFDRRNRTFSHRLVVTARLVGWSRAGG
jgi:LPXTG-site transpeptidase (sortase) family protein